MLERLIHFYSMKNFILVGTQRTGSSALAELIGYHPDIVCGWEWTQHAPKFQKILAAELALSGDFSNLSAREQAYMKEVYSTNKVWLGYRRLFRSSNKWLLHPKLSPALWVDRLEAHIKWLRRRADIHIIHLRRNNNLAWLKSKFFSKESGTYVGKAYPENIEIRIPVNEAIARIKSKMWVDTRLATLRESNAYHEVWYEDFSVDKVAVAHNVYQFLGCKTDAVNISQEAGRKRQSSGSLAKGILNYDDLLLILNQQNLLGSGREIVLETLQ